MNLATKGQAPAEGLLSHVDLSRVLRVCRHGVEHAQSRHPPLWESTGPASWSLRAGRIGLFRGRFVFPRPPLRELVRLSDWTGGAAFVAVSFDGVAPSVFRSRFTVLLSCLGERHVGHARTISWLGCGEDQKVPFWRRTHPHWGHVQNEPTT